MKACLLASESGQVQPIPVLEDKSQKAYPAFVVRLAAEEQTWSTVHGKIISWTPEKSAEIQGQLSGAPKVWKKYTAVFKPYITNTVNPSL
eukprot:2465958-Pleurochrysis_carterae.AAC.1